MVCIREEARPCGTSHSVKVLCSFRIALGEKGQEARVHTSAWASREGSTPGTWGPWVSSKNPQPRDKAHRGDRS